MADSLWWDVLALVLGIAVARASIVYGRRAWAFAALASIAIVLSHMLGVNWHGRGLEFVGGVGLGAITVAVRAVLLKIRVALAEKSEKLPEGEASRAV